MGFKRCSCGVRGWSYASPTRTARADAHRGHPSGREASGQDQVDVAELVPEVALGQAGLVGALEQLAGRRPPRASSRCDASGSCHPVSRPSTARTPRSGVITRSVQPSKGCTTPSSSTAVSSARTTVVPTAITRCAALAGGVDPGRGGGGHTGPLRVGQLVGLERGHAGVQHDGRDADALGHEPGDHLGRERAAGAGHLGAARLGGVDVLVGAERPRPLDVAVADRPAVARPATSAAAAAACRLGDPEPARRPVRRQQVERCVRRRE